MSPGHCKPSGQLSLNHVRTRLYVAMVQPLFARNRLNR